MIYLILFFIFADFCKAQFSLVQTVKNLGGSYDDRLGESAIATNGKWAAMFAPNVDLNGGNKNGQAYIFGKDIGGENNWGLHRSLDETASEITTGKLNLYGSVSMTNDHLIIGDPYYDGQDTDTGAIYIYRKDNGGVDNWGFVKKIEAPGVIPSLTRFGGRPSSIDGSTIISCSGDFGDGTCWVFEKDQGGTDNWGYVTQFTAPVQVSTDDFGRVDAPAYIRGDRFFVSADGHEAGSSLNTGAIYVFERNQGGANNWGMVKLIDEVHLNGLVPGSINDGDTFGRWFDVSADGNVLAVSSPYSDLDGLSNAGKVFIINYDSGSWSIEKLVYHPAPAANNAFGHNGVVLTEDGTRLIVPDKGKNQQVFVFRNDEGGNGNWGLEQTLTGFITSQISVAAGIDYYGGSLIIGDRTLSDGVTANLGGFYVFEKSCDQTWTEVPEFTCRVTPSYPPISLTTESSIEDCQAICELDPSCFRYVYDDADSSCRTYEFCLLTTPTTQTMKVKDMCGYETFQGKYCDGSSGGFFASESWQDCIDHCTATENCVGMTKNTYESNTAQGCIISNSNTNTCLINSLGSAFTYRILYAKPDSVTTYSPTTNPTGSPTISPIVPTPLPTNAPSRNPTFSPIVPTPPTIAPTQSPTPDYPFCSYEEIPQGGFICNSAARAPLQTTSESSEQACKDVCTSLETCNYYVFKTNDMTCEIHGICLKSNTLSNVVSSAKEYCYEFYPKHQCADESSVAIYNPPNLNMVECINDCNANSNCVATMADASRCVQYLGGPCTPVLTSRGNRDLWVRPVPTASPTASPVATQVEVGKHSINFNVKSASARKQIIQQAISNVNTAFAASSANRNYVIKSTENAKVPLALLQQVNDDTLFKTKYAESRGCSEGQCTVNIVYPSRRVLERLGRSLQESAITVTLSYELSEQAFLDLEASGNTLDDPAFITSLATDLGVDESDVNVVSDGGTVTIEVTVTTDASGDPTGEDAMADLQEIAASVDETTTTLVNQLGTTEDTVETVSLDLCGSRTCSGVGNTDVEGTDANGCAISTGICECQDGYWGVNCETLCACDNGGSCRNSICHCAYPYFGLRCEFQKTCSCGTSAF